MPNEIINSQSSVFDDPEAKIPPQRIDHTTAGHVSAQPVPLKRRTRGRFWKGVAALCLLSGGGGFLWATQTTAGRDITTPIFSVVNDVMVARSNPNLVFDTVNSDHFNILLVGRDVNYKQVYDKYGRNIRHVVDTATPARSDTMIVMSLNKTNHTIRMISLPRDARVHLPSNKEGVRRAKLNAAHAYGGVDLLKKTLHDELGLTIHRYAVIKFDGFKKLIDEVGGVYVDVIGPVSRDGKRLDLIYDDNWGNLHVHLKPGKQWLDGQKAHDYVRFRMDREGDTGRIRRQQSVMRALAGRLKEMPPWKLPGIVKEIRRQFETDMNDSELASAGFFAKDLSGGPKVQPVTLFGVYATRGTLTLNRPKNEMLLKTVFGPTFDTSRFLVNSPSTEDDEIGPENNASPETLELLREAGIIKGAPKPDVLVANSQAESSESSTPDVAPPTDEMTSSPANIDRPIVRDEEPAPRRRVRRRNRQSETVDTEEDRPRRRKRARRVESDNSERQAPARAESGRDSSEGNSRELNVESPIPQPEAEESAGESPIPQPE